MPEPPAILFTAFEPSGDEHASVVIRRLRELRPDVPIYALGGPKMQDAGATLIEQTTGDAAMLANAIAKVGEHRAIRKRFARWLDDHPIAVHVPTDSPAANWGLAIMVKQRWGDAGAKTVHLVAPQVWAWASWRVNKLRTWSDLVLCVLPFEPQWFAKHNVTGRFIGHPLFDHELDAAALKRDGAALGEAFPKIALLPGSRPGEIKANWRVIWAAFQQLAQRYPSARAAIAAAHDRAESIIRHRLPEIPPNATLRTGETDAVLHWADVVITVSGTVTLHVARHRKPMVIVYRGSRWQWWLLGRWIISTRTFTLPNLIAAAGPHRDPSRHIVRELIPLLSDNPRPIVEEVATPTSATRNWTPSPTSCPNSAATTPAPKPPPPSPISSPDAARGLALRSWPAIVNLRYCAPLHAKRRGARLIRRSGAHRRGLKSALHSDSTKNRLRVVAV